MASAVSWYQNEMKTYEPDNHIPFSAYFKEAGKQNTDKIILNI